MAGFEQQIKERAKELKVFFKKGVKIVGESCKKGLNLQSIALARDSEGNLLTGANAQMHLSSALAVAASARKSLYEACPQD
ncbi:hypothetical protein J1N35_015501 [Gossypium stocksii]|uniref:Uncharacterized protein n=1 Tax=Gossypium stocksii TaxID=47602 RepID=A0A9D3VX25_9ROSI|nr:hypothetical protein J1N35_015501 [Gossypium stocksii]